ncbi:hypothetical protein BW247_06175 [Acidihalobacter ferrooxydans]|uniref:histidine kinase n=1 Tax=Acidihalobacter ferrooxydans TaxID=1765967 RepID=A0A1P8UFV6_9GAMM|nr:hypothetical protein BW247_06175 [Acidihalobacter ferrooxydans]
MWSWIKPLLQRPPPVPSAHSFDNRDAIAALIHEINNPLSTLVNAAFALSEQAGATPERRQFAQTLRGEARRIHHLADTMGMLCRHQNVEHANFDLTDVLNDLLLLARLEPGLRGERQLLIRSSEGPLPVRGDAELIQQVLWNLLLNASHHGVGDIELEVQLQRKQVKLCICNRCPQKPPANDGMTLDLSLSNYILSRHRSTLCLIRHDDRFEASFILQRTRRLEVQ